MDDLIETYGKLGELLVFIAVGGKEIKNRIKDAFPKMISIFSYYHVCQHLLSFAIVVLTGEAKEKKD